MLVVSLLFSISAPALAAQKATATILRLEKAEGTVETKNASGKVVSKRAGTRLYSGYQVSTQKASYAYIMTPKRLNWMPPAPAKFANPEKIWK